MEREIRKRLEQIEVEKNVKILYACESGSRVWGFASKDSDYDVRFIYIHPIEWYLSIGDQRDVIDNISLDNNIDISGWDIRKTLKLFRKSNPPLLEWLSSPTVYMHKYAFRDRLNNLLDTYYSRRSCIYHYLHMAKRNYREYLQEEQVWTKKYFYVLRPILTCLWVEERETIPPIQFDNLLHHYHRQSKISDELFLEFNQLLVRKRTGDELSRGPKIQEVNDFLDAEIERLSEVVKDVPQVKQPPAEALDKLFQKMLRRFSPCQ